MKKLTLHSLICQTSYEMDRPEGRIQPLAAIVVEVEEEGRKKVYKKSVFGVGGVDAICRAINEITCVTPEIKLYHCRAITNSTESPAVTQFCIEYCGLNAVGDAEHGDVLISAALAYVNAINDLFEKCKLRGFID